MQPLYYLMCTGMLGLLVGSFLNVVIHRLPIMLNQAWQKEYPLCAVPNETTAALSDPTLSNLLTPRSHYSKISHRYPLIECTTALISVFVVQHFGLHWQSISALILSWGLITLTVIDIDHQLLPDVITLPLLWLRLLISLFNVHVDTKNAIIGAAVGYMCFWSIAKLFKIIRKKDGLGEGDFKLLAALGAWLGWQPLPAVILIASLLGLISCLSLILTKPYHHYRNRYIPFGPYLSLAGWIMLIWGQNIMHIYLSLADIS